MIFPGTPWRATRYSSVVGLGVIGAQGRIIAMVPTLPNLSADQLREAESIVHLLAEAPALYDTLDEVNQVLLRQEIEAKLLRARNGAIH
jgi:hypothetical protein